MSEEDTTNMFNEVISKEDSEIIDFINQRELFYETQTRSNILSEVEKKFGNKGKEVLSQLNDDISVTPDDLECNDCGQLSKEVTDEMKCRLELLDIIFDTQLDEVVRYVVFQNMGGNYINIGLVQEAIVRYTNYKIGEIPDEVIHKAKIKIIFDGIQKRWLMDELFVY
jgi:hypothetical protein